MPVYFDVVYMPDFMCRITRTRGGVQNSKPSVSCWNLTQIVNRFSAVTELCFLAGVGKSPPCALSPDDWPACVWDTFLSSLRAAQYLKPWYSGHWTCADRLTDADGPAECPRTQHAVFVHRSHVRQTDEAYSINALFSHVWNLHANVKLKLYFLVFHRR